MDLFLWIFVGLFVWICMDLFLWTCMDFCLDLFRFSNNGAAATVSQRKVRECQTFVWICLDLLFGFVWVYLFEFAVWIC